jgi:hypothetical protein
MSTVKIEFTIEGEKSQMVFGDSYKTWQMQLQEFVWYLKGRERNFTIGELLISRSKFVQNGLKWCSAESFQSELDEEGAYYKRKPRQFERFGWVRIALPPKIEL